MPASWIRALAFIGLVCVAVHGLLAPPAPRNVLVLLVDTLRADHLHLYGYTRPTSPNLDRLAGDGVVFERARSQASCTFPSVNSLLTSRFSGHFMGRKWGDFTIPGEFTTAGELLRANGLATFAVSASGVVRATPSKVNPGAGFGRGFDIFDEGCFSRAASCVNEHFLRILDQRRPERFFAYLHYMEPHHPYAPPRTYARRFTQRTNAPAWVLAGNPDPIEKAIVSGKPSPATAQDLRTLTDLYDEEIAYWDSELQRLFDALKSRGLRRSTLIVLAADHGEMFLEHGNADIKHCRQLWETVTHVPLVLWIPGATGRRVSTAVQNVDILPTILDYLGARQDGWRAEGQSLRPLATGAHEPRLAFSSQDSLRSVNDARFKLIRDVASGRVQLYDVLDDPGERTDLASERVEARVALDGALDAWIASSDRANTESGGRAARDVESALRALGYLQ